MSTNYIPKFSDADTVVDSSIQDTGSQVIVGNPILSPALTGTPTAPTATAGTNTTQIATTAFVATAVAAEEAARETLESELTAESSARVAEDTNLQANIGAEASARTIADTAQSFTGSTGTNPYSASTPLTPRFLGDKAYNITSQEWWHGISTNGSTSSWLPTLSGTDYAQLASPALTGTPTSPTASAGTNTTQIATTAFVATAVLSEATDRAAADTALTTNLAAEVSRATTAEALKANTADLGSAAAEDVEAFATAVQGAKADSALQENQTITVSGDATGSGKTAIALTLASTSVTSGNYGSASSVPVITVDAKGRITSAVGTAIQLPESQVTNLATDLAAKAPLASPAFTGTPIAPTAAAGTNTTQVATTAFVTTAVASVGGGDTITLSGDVTGSGTTSISTTLTTSGVSSGTYGSATAVPSITVDTKGRITSASSTAIQITESQVTNLTTDLAAKAALASPALTGTPTAPTASTGTNTTQVATTAFVAATVASYAPSITPINAQTGTTYTLVASDAGKIVTCTNSSAITVTVPASIFSAGQSVIIGQSGAGQVTLSTGSGMTLNTTSTLKTKSQYSRIAVMFDSSSAATIVGERAAS